MQWKKLGSTGAPAYVVVLDPGDEAIAALSEFSHREGLSAAQVNGIGAFGGVTVGLV